MIRKSGTGLVIALLLFGIALVLPVSAGNVVELLPEINFSENSEVSNVDYSYYSYFFGLSSYGNTVITRYGKLPILETEEQKENWNSTLEELSNKIKGTLASKYMYPHGEVVTCGMNAGGYFVILFKYGNVDKSLINEIYTLINDSAKEMSIQDIPVEFAYGTYQAEIPLDSEKGIYHTFGHSATNLSEADIRTIEEYMREKPEQTEYRKIADYGKIPLLKDQKEIDSWFEKLSSIKSNIEEQMWQYGARDEVKGYGVVISRMEVSIYQNLPSREKVALSEEIYQIIDEEATKQNVTDVPVIFVDANSSKESKPTKISFTPGFGLLGSLACLCVGWKLMRNS